MRIQGLAALATSGTLVTAYHVLQPAPELGVTPEMLNWGPGWVGWTVGVVVSIVILAVIIGMAIDVARWLIGLRDWT